MTHEDISKKQSSLGATEIWQEVVILERKQINLDDQFSEVIRIDHVAVEANGAAIIGGMVLIILLSFCLIVISLDVKKIAEHIRTATQLVIKGKSEYRFD